MATNFLYAPGTDGFVTSPFNLLTTELNTLANGNTAVSSVGGSSGVFSQTQTLGCIFAYISLVMGGAFAATPAAGGSISGWFLGKDDDTNFEKVISNVAQPRAPDFVLPVYAQTYAANDLIKCNGLVRLPPNLFKVVVQNNAGASASLTSTGNKLVCGPIAIQY